MSRLCLVMIVKDESKVIGRCIMSCKGLISAACIVDTGSTDNTIDKARAHLSQIGLPESAVDIHHREWLNFGHNRSEALALAREHCAAMGGDDWYLIGIDADEVFTFPPGWKVPKLTEPGYSLFIELGPTRYTRALVWDAKKPWKYVGAMHELPVLDGYSSNVVIQGLETLSFGDGARSANRQKTFESDAKMLDEVIEKDPSLPRETFYCAQCHQCAGNLDRANELYLKRLDLGGYRDEIFVSLLRLASIAQQQGKPDPQVAMGYLQAYQFDPDRAEPLIALANLFRGKTANRGPWPRVASIFYAAGSALPRPDGKLFVDKNAYRWDLSPDVR